MFGFAVTLMIAGVLTAVLLYRWPYSAIVAAAMLCGTFWLALTVAAAHRH